MDAFIRQTALVAPLDRSNVNTDDIIPKQFLKTIKKTGLGVNLFYDWRYLNDPKGHKTTLIEKNGAFVLNADRYQGAGILLTRENFGCGSSREHAPWALLDYGFRSIIAPSFADIFYNNCFKNGILPVVLSYGEIDQLFSEVFSNTGYRLTIDLSEQKVNTPSGTSFIFACDQVRKNYLLKGLDEIAISMKKDSLISAYEAQRFQEAPWLTLLRSNR